ncbi:MAG TPA: hypothetical protein VFN26_09060 [Candidatus Acidoferrum sp.]|nr:hypothetical protein [Candidatus Acidoferrum sp.]
MRKWLIPVLLTLALTFFFAVGAKADTVSAGGVTYSFTHGVSDGSGGYFVILKIDGTAAVASASLPLFSVQFFDGSTSATSASISSGPAGWAVAGLGNVNQCGTGSLPFFCSTGPGLAVGGPGDVYTFTFDVKGLPGQPTGADIQAWQHVNGALTISSGVGVSEPSSLMLLGAALLGAALLVAMKALK